MLNRERQITFKIFEVGFNHLEQSPDGRYDMKYTYLFTVQDTRLSEKEARRQCKEQGFKIPCGSEVVVKAVGKVKYFFTTDDLMTIARKVEE